MTLGINNGMIMIMRLMGSLIIMEEFELSGPPELLYLLNRLLRTVRKYHSRCFLNNLKYARPDLDLPFFDPFLPSRFAPNSQTVSRWSS